MKTKTKGDFCSLHRTFHSSLGFFAVGFHICALCLQFLLYASKLPALIALFSRVLVGLFKLGLQGGVRFLKAY
jgi:hypothetical protein